jgi:hypothetical protein
MKQKCCPKVELDWNTPKYTTRYDDECDDDNDNDDDDDDDIKTMKMIKEKEGEEEKNVISVACSKYLIW